MIVIYSLPSVNALPFPVQAAPTGLIYLLHFERPIGNPLSPFGMAQHYLGHATGGITELTSRLDTHARGGSGAARIMAEVARLGVTWQVVALWRGSRSDERYFKSSHKNFPCLCPICQHARQRRLYC